MRGGVIEIFSHAPLKRIARLTPGVFERNWPRVVVVSLAVGVAGGLAAVFIETGLHYAVHWISEPFLPEDRVSIFNFHWVYLLLPVLGGAFSSLLTYYALPKSKHQGTELYLEAFHEKQGELDVKEPAVQAVAALGVIGCGGSAGPESPTAALGASVGSFLCRLFRVRPQERKNFLVAGCAAGVGAVFHCPLGGAFFANDVLYSDPELSHEALIPSLVASVSAYVTFTSLTGQSGALFPGLEQIQFQRPAELLAYGVLGIFCVLGALLLKASLRGTRYLLDKTKIPRLWRPAAGGLLCGALAILVPQVLDPNYELLESLLAGHTSAPDKLPSVGVGMLFLFVIARVVATGFTIGSGNAGGILGPSIRIGGLCGAAMGALIGGLFPEWTTHELHASLIAVGMSGVLVAGMRVPLAGLVMVIEMTHCYGLIVPLMMTCSIAYLVGRHATFCDGQVRNAFESPAYLGQAMGNLLEDLRVSEAVVPGSKDTPLRLGTPLEQIAAIFQERTEPYLPVVDAEGRYHGMLSREGVNRELAGKGLKDRKLWGADLVWLDVLDSRASAQEALEHLVAERLPVLPVVDSKESLFYQGYVTGHSIEETFCLGVNEMLAPLKERMPQVTDFLLSHDLATVLSRRPGLLNSPALREIEVPVEVIGQTLGQSNFRAHFAQQIVAIRRRDRTLVLPATANDRFLAGDTLLVMSDKGR